jgi:hypothetical protein
MESGCSDCRFATHNTGCPTDHTVIDINRCDMGAINSSWYTDIYSATLV